MRRALGRLTGLAIVLVVAGGGTAAATTIGPSRVGPHQFFVGEVNGRFSDATVKVICPGPSTVGHALPGQTLAVSAPPVVLQNSGNTGANGRRIVAVIGPVASTAGTVVFTRYDEPKPFPTTVTVPCGGTSVIRFVPVPGGPGAKAATVTVAWVNMGVAAARHQ
jgi:hypothetical protein